ncbi:MAG TPA: Type 1 glutamine amidotransferase-like domain-containing protein [Candidatus Paceibacterota bacterium]|nr:Type 1 glutamine amidotransferase-like domain-containing protein [Candidatus Paceibacterota bacterium]
MKLFLTSAGFADQNLRSFFIGNLGESPVNLRVVMLALIKDSEEKFYVDLSRKELEEIGFTSIKFINLNEGLEPKALEKFDLVYVCGGNTFAIYKKIKESGFAGKIEELVKDDKLIYIGVSAGSIIAGPDIEIAGWGSEGDENEVGLQELKGLGLTEVSVFPHYHEELKDEVEAFRRKVSYPVVELRNDQLVYVEGDNWEII